MVKQRPLTAMALAVGVGFWLGYTRRRAVVSAAMAVGNLFEEDLKTFKSEAVSLARELAEQSVSPELAPKVGPLIERAGAFLLGSTSIP